MRRSIIALAMMVMLGIGLLAGSVMTSYGDAQNTNVAGTGPAYTLPTMPPYAGVQYTYPVQIRWQVIIVPGVEQGNIPVTILLDTLTGESFFLKYATNGNYHWSRISR